MVRRSRRETVNRIGCFVLLGLIALAILGFVLLGSQSRRAQESNEVMSRVGPAAAPEGTEPTQSK